MNTDTMLAPRLASTRHRADQLYDNMNHHPDLLCVDMSENESFSISFIQQIVKRHITDRINDNTSVTFINARQRMIDKVNMLYNNSAVEIRHRINVELKSNLDKNTDKA